MTVGRSGAAPAPRRWPTALGDHRLAIGEQLGEPRPREGPDPRRIGRSAAVSASAAGEIEDGVEAERGQPLRELEIADADAGHRGADRLARQQGDAAHRPRVRCHHWCSRQARVDSMARWMPVSRSISA